MHFNSRYWRILLLIPLVFFLASCKSNRSRNLIVDADVEEPPTLETLPPSLAPVEPAPPIIVDPPVVELPISPNPPVNPPVTPPVDPPVNPPVDPPVNPPVIVPEPLTILGAGAAVALGFKFKQRGSRK
ncbi:MAG: PEP-CTERM sorting domain-containing protein [Cyanobacteria bacterium RI_101]|nr:PEP-CTERM sorting domain-containing protein [Cyanobacteria bacterium RI_101]